MVNAITIISVTKVEQQQEEESFFLEKFEGCKKHALLDKLRDCALTKSWLEDIFLYPNGR